jgi:hypothetical protein
MSFENMIGEQEETGLESSTSDRGGFPLIMWLNGDPGAVKMGVEALEYVGGWFTTEWYQHDDKITQYIPEGADGASYVEIDLAPFGWRKDYFCNAAGAQINGWYRRNLEASLICGRERWLIYEEKDGRDVVRAFTKYNDAVTHGAPRSNMQVLSIIKGMEALGPVVISLKGYAMMSFKGQRDFMATGVITGLKKYVTDVVAAKLTPPGGKPPHINYRSVWCVAGPRIGSLQLADSTEFIKAGKGEEGKMIVVQRGDGIRMADSPEFIKAGKGEKSKMIVVPSYVGVQYTPETIDLATVYVGDEINAQVNQLFDDNKEWAIAWSNLTGEHDAAPETPAEKAAEKEAEILTAIAETAGL